ncbi:MAG: hypothetical protein IAG10_18345 [Planctomycetaceae bacterium]|nr:hypothetical protein [Planctomycetaceae bacterium]
MPRRFQMLFVASLVATAFTVHSHRAWSGEKHRRTICCQPIATCQPIASQTAGTTPTCCQPVAATIFSSSSPIELCAHTQPAPRRLTPQPDTLDINPTVATTYCAIYMVADYGTYQVYYGINCTTHSPVSMSGNNLGPLPGNCNNPGGACITFGSSVIPTASGASGLQRPGTFTQKGIKLARKHKAGEEPSNQANPQATKPRELKERTRIGQPIFVKFPRVPGSSDFVVAELQRFSVKGIGAAGKELSGAITVGLEIDQAPAGKTVKELSRDQVTIADDHVARVEIGNATYEIITASNLTP